MRVELWALPRESKQGKVNVALSKVIFCQLLNVILNLGEAKQNVQKGFECIGIVSLDKHKIIYN